MDRREFVEIATAAGISMGCTGILKMAEALEPPIVKNERNVFTAPLLRVDVPNGNNRIYPREVVEQAIAKFQSDTPRSLTGMLGTPEGSSIPFSQMCCFIDNLHINDNGYLIGEFTALKTPAGETFQQMMATFPDKVAFRTIGVARLTEDNRVSNFYLTGVSVLEKDKAATI